MGFDPVSFVDFTDVYNDHDDLFSGQNSAGGITKFTKADI
jgi:hypothetical protein